MWYGTDTKELIKAKEEYKKKFGYNPDGEMGVEYCEGEQSEYIKDIKKCIKEGIDIGALFSDYEDDD